MSNQLIPTAGGAMPAAFNRRTFLTNTGAGALAVSVVAVPVIASAAWREPLVDAIDAYHAGNAAYEDHPLTKTLEFSEADEAVAIAETYGPPDAVLRTWSDPALTYGGAVAALRLAQLEAQAFSCSDVLNNMIDAALGYLEAKGA